MSEINSAFLQVNLPLPAASQLPAASHNRNNGHEEEGNGANTKRGQPRRSPWVAAAAGGGGGGVSQNCCRVGSEQRGARAHVRVGNDVVATAPLPGFESRNGHGSTAGGVQRKYEESELRLAAIAIAPAGVLRRDLATRYSSTYSCTGLWLPIK
jgi:hypothetical protein